MLRRRRPSLPHKQLQRFPRYERKCLYDIRRSLRNQSDRWKFDSIVRREIESFFLG